MAGTREVVGWRPCTPGDSPSANFETMQRRLQRPGVIALYRADMLINYLHSPPSGAATAVY